VDEIIFSGRLHSLLCHDPDVVINLDKVRSVERTEYGYFKYRYRYTV